MAVEYEGRACSMRIILCKKRERENEAAYKSREMP